MTEYATDTSPPEEEVEDLKPLEVKITNQPKEKQLETSEDTEDIYQYTPTDEEIKEMTDAQ